ncbi:MAG: sodium:solute symporter family protein [Candidatus Zixiibacteriota bacterium]
MIDIFIIIIYFALMLIVGWRSRKHTAESYWVADRQYGTARISASLVATIFGASSTIGIIGLGYTQGLTASWWLLTGAVALILFGLFLATRVRELGVYTLPDILSKAYNKKTAIPAGLMITIAWCGVIAAQMVAGGRLLGGLLNIDFDLALAVISFIFILYTFWGGQLSVIKTDYWQLLLFVAGLFFMFLFLAAGDGNMWKVIPSSHLYFPINNIFGWYDLLIYYPLIIGLPYLVGPDIYSRVLSAKDGPTAKKSAFIASMIIVPLAFLLAGIGIMAYVKIPGIVPETAFSEVLSNYIPVGMKGIIVAGFLGAIMSSADTCLVSASTIFTLNVLKPLRRKSGKDDLKITRTVLIVVGIISWLVATFEKGIISSLLLGYTVFVGGVVVPTLASFWKEKLKISPNGALWAIIIGGSAAILGKFDNGNLMKLILPGTLEHFFANVLGYRYLSILPIFLSALTLIIVSRFSYKDDV